MQELYLEGQKNNNNLKSWNPKIINPKNLTLDGLRKHAFLWWCLHLWPYLVKIRIQILTHKLIRSQSTSAWFGLELFLCVSTYSNMLQISLKIHQSNKSLIAFCCILHYFTSIQYFSYILWECKTKLWLSNILGKFLSWKFCCAMFEVRWSIFGRGNFF